MNESTSSNTATRLTTRPVACLKQPEGQILHHGMESQEIEKVVPNKKDKVVLFKKCQTKLNIVNGKLNLLRK